jgi:periplasmic protein TonB
MRSLYARVLVLSVFLALVYGFPTYGQSNPSRADSTRASQDTVFTVPEVAPHFPGGQDALLSFLNKQVTYPVEAKEKDIQGRVIVSFVITKEGHVSDVHIARSVHTSLDKEAMRVVRLLPNWAPGTINGRPVAVRYNLPISFKLEEGSRRKNRK